MTVHIELPYDRGHQWHIVVGTKKAVVSERAAIVLAGRFGVTIHGEPSLPEKFAAEAARIGSDYYLSKKARKMLERAGVTVES